MEVLIGTEYSKFMFKALADTAYLTETAHLTETAYLTVAVYLTERAYFKKINKLYLYTFCETILNASW